MKRRALLANINAAEICYGIQCQWVFYLLFRQWQLKADGLTLVLVEIVGIPQIDQLMAGMRSTGHKGTRMPFRVLLNIGRKPIKVISSSILGGYFNISEVAPGKYSVNGAL